MLISNKCENCGNNQVFINWAKCRYYIAGSVEKEYQLKEMYLNNWRNRNKGNNYGRIKTVSVLRKYRY